MFKLFSLTGREAALFCFLFYFFLSCTPGESSFLEEDPNWTVIVYLGAANNLEQDLLNNIEQMKAGFNGGCNLLVLVDRGNFSSNSSVLGERFIGTRLYRVIKDSAIRLYGDETFPELQEGKESNLNSGDAEVLKKLIRYCKKNYPANHYALMIGSHGGGSRSDFSTKSVVVDSDSGNDWIYTAEFTDVLERDDSVDLLALDACYMGNLEFIYQLSHKELFHAEYFVASPAAEWSYGWNYEKIFQRINGRRHYRTEEEEFISGGKEEVYLSSRLTPLQFAGILVEEQYDYVRERKENQTLSCYTAEGVIRVKNQLDILAGLLKEERETMNSLRGTGRLLQDETLHYFNSRNVEEWVNYPFVDLYDMAKKMVASGSFPLETARQAEILASLVDEAVIYSFSGGYYSRAVRNTTGLSIFFPDGSRTYNGKRMWAYQCWYNAVYLPDYKPGTYYGKLLFCIDNAVPNNGKVENWFELLDSWFDAEGDTNYYTF